MKKRGRLESRQACFHPVKKMSLKSGIVVSPAGQIAKGTCDTICRIESVTAVFASEKFEPAEGMLRATTLHANKKPCNMSTAGCECLIGISFDCGCHKVAHRISNRHSRLVGFGFWAYGPKHIDYDNLQCLLHLSRSRSISLLPLLIVSNQERDYDPLANSHRHSSE